MPKKDVLVQKRKGRQPKKVKVIVELRQQYELNVLLKVLGVKKTTLFYTINKVNKDDKNEEIFKRIEEIHHQNKRRYHSVIKTTSASFIQTNMK